MIPDNTIICDSCQNEAPVSDGKCPFNKATYSVEL